MSRKFKLTGLLALLLALVVGGTALAQTATPATPTTPGTTQTAPTGKGPGDRLLGGWDDAGRWVEFDAAAKALNLTPTQLFDQLHSGKTLSEIATAQNVTAQAVQDAVNAVRADAYKAQLDQAVKDGRITQDQADWLLKGMQNGWTGGRFGGFGEGGHGGRGHGGAGLNGGNTAPTQQAPTATPGA